MVLEKSMRRTVLRVCLATMTVVCATAPAFSELDYIGAGPRLNLVVSDVVGAGIGGGGQMQFGFSLGRFGALHIYPNLDMWWGRKHYHEIWGTVDFNYFEVAMNADARYYFPVPVSLIMAPYAGLGLGCVFFDRSFDPESVPAGFSDYTDFGASGNIFAGIDFPIGPHKIFGEIRGKFGEGYDLMMFVGGFTFTIR